MKQFLLIICLVLLLVVTVIPAFASPSISAISPTTALNNRDVTMTITGTGFNADSTVWIDTPASTESIPGTIISRSPTAITCTFSIQGTTPARYNVWVNSPFTDMAGTYHPQDVGLLQLGFTIDKGADTTPRTTISPTPAPANGSISVSSIPPGANVYLDGVNKGLTPLVLKNVENGKHAISVRLAGYGEYTDSVVVSADSPTVSARLIALPAATPETMVPARTTSIPVTVPPMPTTTSPSGIGIGILAITGAALLVMKRS